MHLHPQHIGRLERTEDAHPENRDQPCAVQDGHDAADRDTGISLVPRLPTTTPREAALPSQC